MCSKLRPTVVVVDVQCNHAAAHSSEIIAFSTAENKAQTHAQNTQITHKTHIHTQKHTVQESIVELIGSPLLVEVEIHVFFCCTFSLWESIPASLFKIKKAAF